MPFSLYLPYPKNCENKLKPPISYTHQEETLKILLRALVG